MNPTNWQQVKELFTAALELDADDRAAFLKANSANDDGLLRQVAELLSAHEEAGAFLQAPALVDAGVLIDCEAAAAESSLIGKEIGNYEVIRELGRGGMGAVYLAVRSDDAYKKQVAIKLIKRGMDTEAIIRRFVMERQILANLDHQNIARLLDGGVGSDGLPYFVMEYIEGTPIRLYCDENNLDVVERLKLFRQACSAVQYAHQNLVVHRDLKPGNILVTDEGVPKLLDFGIAKLLSSDWSSTIEPTTIGRLLTPEYASPEQLRGLPVTTTSDVYSLGVVLYELLSGHRPFQFASGSPDELIKAVCETDPPKPSEMASGRWTRSTERTGNAVGAKITEHSQTGKQTAKLTNPKSLRGDLDNILLKALRKEPERRYASVQEFSEDLYRHIAGLPVLARDDTFTYRAGKFARRHKVGVLGAALILVSLLAGMVTTAWQARRANAERNRADLRFNQVRKLASAVLFDYHDAIEKFPGSTAVREKMVRDSLEYLDNLSAENDDDPSLQQELASAYQKVGHVQGNPYNSNLGDAAGAMVSYSKAAAIREVLAAADPGNTTRQVDLASSYRSIADLLWAKGDNAGAFVSYQKMLSVADKLHAANPTQVENKFRLIDAHYHVGQTLKAQADLQKALESFRTALKLSEESLTIEPNNPKLRVQFAQATLKVGDVMFELGDYSQALDNHHRAFEIAEGAASGDPHDSRLQRLLAFCFSRIALDQKHLGRINDAVENQRKGLEILKRLADADANDQQLRGDLAFFQSDLGDFLAQQGKVPEAVAYLRKAILLLSELVSKDPDYVQTRVQLGIAHSHLGAVLLESNRAREAMDSYLKALAILETEALTSDNLSVLARIHSHMGDAETKLAKETKATEPLRQAERRYQQSFVIWKDLQQRGALKSDEIGLPEEVGKKISDCAKALARRKRK